MEARAIDFHNQASVEQEIHITDSRQVDLGAHIETVPPQQYPGHWLGQALERVDEDIKWPRAANSRGLSRGGVRVVQKCRRRAQ
jgi:hypothetical protein